MARSNSRDFKLNRDQLIKRAFQVINIYDLNTTIPNDENQFASDLLNAMMKQWQAEGLHLWNRREATLFTAKDTASYSLGAAGTHATTSYVSTLLNGALAISATAVTVDSTTGMTASDNIGIELTDGTRHWDTIASVDSSTTLTLTTGIVSAASDNARVVSYTDKINRPLLVLHSRVGDLSTDSEITTIQLRRNDYFDISDKTSAGRPNGYYYDKQLDEGTIYLWPRPDDVDYIVNFSYYDQVEDVDSGTDDLDYPQEWTLALIWGLGLELAQTYNMYAELPLLQQKVMQLKMAISDFNYDEESILIRPAGKR
jgi:hypothetical protein